MKKLFVLFILLVSFVAYGQNNIAQLKFTTLVEATTQTGYLPLGEWSRIDSLTLALAGYGEVDVDSVVAYIGYQVPGVGGFFSATAYTFLTDPNIAASTKFYTDGCGTTAVKVAATLLTSAVMKSAANVLKVVIYPADGCAAGNYVYTLFKIHGVPLGGT